MLVLKARWNMTLHYNSWDNQAPNAGWNGFSTISDFYNSFGAVTATNQPVTGLEDFLRVLALKIMPIPRLIKDWVEG